MRAKGAREELGCPERGKEEGGAPDAAGEELRADASKVSD